MVLSCLISVSSELEADTAHLSLYISLLFMLRDVFMFTYIELKCLYLTPRYLSAVIEYLPCYFVLASLF